MSRINLPSNINRNLNRGNTQQSDNDEEVNTTMSKFSNNKSDQHEFDNLSISSSAYNKKKDNLKSNDNLTQVNKMYPTKKSSKNPEELVKGLKQDIEITSNEENSFEEEYVDPDSKIAEYMEENKFEIKKDDTLFCVCVDGSPHSEFAFEIVIQDLIKETDKLFVVHIYNNRMDETYIKIDKQCWKMVGE